jgi:hypothetical protein
MRLFAPYFVAFLGQILSDMTCERRLVWRKNPLIIISKYNS